MTEAECVPYDETIQNYTCICDGKNVTATFGTKGNTNNDESEGKLFTNITL